MSLQEASNKDTQNFVVRVAHRLAGSFVEATPNWVHKAIEAWKKLTIFFSNEAWDNWCDKLHTDGYIDSDTAQRLKPMSQYRFPWGGVLMMLVLVKVRMTDLSSVLDIYELDRQYDLMGQTTPHPAPVDNLVRSMIIDPGRATENRVELKKHGYSDLQIDNIILSYYKTVDEGTLRILFLRGIIDSARLYERMRELGYTDQRTGEIIQTWTVIPGPQDLFFMVAKEAFEPDIYTALGLDQEFPSDQIRWLEASGISEDWARKYWIAHWDQPSIGQGFEMLHRGVINNATLDMLFRAIEIPQFWRERLTAIAYKPYTRVDTRRMHDLGVLSDDELIRSYMDQGYDSEKALKMANFTIRFNAEGNAQLTRSAILESYREDLLSHSQAMDLLTEQDYSADLAAYYLELEDFRRDKKLREQQIDNLREQYLLNQLSASGVRDALNRLDLRGEKIDSLMGTWALDAYKYAALPSKSDLDNFLAKGIINEGQYRDYMARHGFSSTMITMYIDDLSVEPIIKGRLPSRANLDEWRKKDLIHDAYYRDEMAKIGYKDEYIELYLKSI